MSRRSVATTTIATRPTVPALVDEIVDALAHVRAMPASEVREEIGDRGGDLEMDSREAEVVLAILEQHHGRPLGRVEDLEPEQLSSITAVAELVHRCWVSASRPGSRR